MRGALPDQHKIASPTQQLVAVDINPVPGQLHCDGLELPAAHEVEVGLMGEELTTKKFHSLACLLLRQPLTPASAQAIGLALHELSTNAGKYGAFSTDTGRVDVNWRTDGDTFNLSWTERDGPPVSPPERRGFGTIMMETMADFVDGAVDLDYAPSGITWRLTCPAANALEPEPNFRAPN